MMPMTQSNDDFAQRIVDTARVRPHGSVLMIAHVTPEYAEAVIKRARQLAASQGVDISHVTIKRHTFGAS